MTKFSESIVVFWMIPVLLQIVLPLIMLAVYGTAKVIRVLFFRKTTSLEPVDKQLVDSKLQPSIS